LGAVKHLRPRLEIDPLGGAFARDEDAPSPFEGAPHADRDHPARPGAEAEPVRDGGPLRLIAGATEQVRLYLRMEPLPPDPDRLDVDRERSPGRHVPSAFPSNFPKKG